MGSMRNSIQRRHWQSSKHKALALDKAILTSKSQFTPVPWRPDWMIRAQRQQQWRRESQLALPLCVFDIRLQAAALLPGMFQNFFPVSALSESFQSVFLLPNLMYPSEETWNYHSILFYIRQGLTSWSRAVLSFWFSYLSLVHSGTTGMLQPQIPELEILSFCLGFPSIYSLWG